jgi:hypothetical protein
MDQIQSLKQKWNFQLNVFRFQWNWLGLVLLLDEFPPLR